MINIYYFCYILTLYMPVIPLCRFGKWECTQMQDWLPFSPFYRAGTVEFSWAYHHHKNPFAAHNISKLSHPSPRSCGQVTLGPLGSCGDVGWKTASMSFWTTASLQNGNLYMDFTGAPHKSYRLGDISNVTNRTSKLWPGCWSPGSVLGPLLC